MKDFETYTRDWLSRFLEDNEETEDFALTLFNAVIDMEPDETIDDYLGKAETPADYLLSLDPSELYPKLFGYGSDNETLRGIFDGLPSTEEFLLGMFLQACPDTGEYSFMKECVEEMAAHAAEYTDPSDFFDDLRNNGCKSGLVGMFIYNDDCLRFYARHANALEAYRERVEDEMGQRVTPDDDVYHYVWICWFCYEELAFSIARALWPDTF